MKGFEIHYNDKTTKVAIKEDCMITIHIFNNNGENHTLKDGESCMYIGGVDYEAYKRIVWYDHSPINIGDRFEIKVVEIDELSKPAQIKEDKTIKRPVATGSSGSVTIAWNGSSYSIFGSGHGQSGGGYVSPSNLN